MRQLFPAALALLLAQCHRHDPDPARPEDQLPPATQTGAGTFSCLLNGQPWTPNSSNRGSDIYITYDPTYAEGSLLIRAAFFPGNSQNNQNIIIGGAPITKPGIYSFTSKTAGAGYIDYNLPAPCNEFTSIHTVTQTGQLTITRFDLAAGIISGTFAFTLAQPGCDTIKVTQGRFDKKL